MSWTDRLRPGGKSGRRLRNAPGEEPAHEATKGGTSEWMVELRSVSKSFGDVAALQEVSLQVRDGEFFTLLGPSGSGKTTVLRVVAGLLDADQGEVLLDGESMKNVPAFERELGVVFQSLALFPHLTVAENIAFSLRMRRVDRTKISSEVRAALDLMQLPNIGHRRISELSGGQRQRVALARSLVYRPRLLLLDEPLSALDRRLRESMQFELTRLHREVGVTIINVTHDQQEALFVSDRVALMDNGRIIQTGRGREIYDKPASEFVASFLGDPLLVTGVVSQEGDHSVLETADSLRLHVASDVPVGRATVVLRPEFLRIVAHGTDARAWDNALPGRVIFTAFDGTGVFGQVALDAGITVSVHAPMRDGLKVEIGEAVTVVWNAR